MVVAVAGSAPVWGPAALQPFDFFRVRRVELVGVRYLAPETVVGAVALRPDASVWDRIGPLAERVRGLAGVGDASVSRRMPGTLRITVREVEPVALAAGADGMITVAADGRPLPYDPSRVAVDVPVVERPEVVLVAALAAVRAADPSLFAQVAWSWTSKAGG
jgi:cell division protein FtsQ